MIAGIKTGVEDIGVNVKEVRDDVNDVGDNVKEVRDDVKDLRKEIKDYFQFSSKVVQVNAMNNTMEKYMNKPSQNQKEIDKNQMEIDKIFQVHTLKISDYKQDDNEKSRKDGRVTKWFNIRIECDEVAFKIISEEEKTDVQNQVTILKELHDWNNIIKFYGITSDGNKRYLVTEWAEHGNLREYYTNNKDQFDLRLKLCMSFDIARGLNFLRAVEIVHRDIRAENILITFNETAKLANFKLSRYLTAATLNQNQNLERVRYCAPELLDRAPNYKYDQRCEVYSFGILLWEIAEERVPYQDSNDIVDIIDKVRNKMYREPFSENSQMPEEFKQLEIEAVRHDPTFRPKITRMFEVLRYCVKDYFSKGHPLSQDSSSSSNSNLSGKTSTKPTPKRAYSIDAPDFESFKYMTLADAAKQHKLYRNDKLIGDIKTAYKCFEAYANSNKTNITNRSNQIKAKYYKALYISRGLVPSPPNKDKIIAELYKEVADDEANEFPEAKVRYGDCLCYGKGVEQDVSEALKYFEKAAEDGVKVAMYNVGNMYYNGIGCTIDTEKAIHYMKLAVYNCYEPAIKFCKEHNL
uniref:Protein kinase domain-containing protein n=1 Tax=Rhizophagus irregularis (strain DAOM 181602 / DAOM 197198 / MUCL 43194) TaxID=747089 RepID=U9UGG7_RHIID